MEMLINTNGLPSET